MKPFISFLLALLFSLLLAACSPAQPVPVASEVTTEPTLTGAIPTEGLPTETLPAPTEPAPELPTAPSAPLPTDTPLLPPTETVSELRIALINPATDILLWRETEPTLTPLVGASAAIDLRLSDDGTMIAYRKDIDIGQQELWAVNADGTNARRLLSVDDLRALDPGTLGVYVNQYDWIPGTHILAFNTVEYVEAPGQFLNNDLYFLDVESNQLTVQLTPGSGGNFVFSPDGLQYAVIQPEAISLLNTDGTNIRSDVLTYPYVLTYSEYNYYVTPVWSPDSTFLRVAIPPQDALGDPTALTTLWDIPTDGSLAVQIGEVLAQPFFIDPVRFSPDLSRIAFTRLPDPNDYLTAELVLARADGSDETVFFTGNVFFQGWNPNSQAFVFDDSLSQTTYLGLSDGVFTNLADFPYVWNVTWLDETHFLFAVQIGASWEFRLGTLGEASILLLQTPDGWIQFDFER